MHHNRKNFIDFSEEVKQCNSCKEIKPFNCFSLNKNSKDGIQSKCKECNKRYRNKNQNHQKAYAKEYYKENKEYFFKRNKKNRENKLNKDPLFRFEFKYRNMFRSLFKYYLKNDFKQKRRLSNSSKFEKIVGCSLSDFKEKIENRFEKGMSWDNYGKWHIDHIKPISLAETKEELIELMKIENIQPLWAVDNIRKSNKVPYENRL